MLDIIHRDSRTIAVNKPAGMLVHRSWLDKHETRFAVQTLRDQIGQHVYPVHRLDRPTSGVLLFALDTEAARLLMQQFENKTIEKTYWAIVRGHLPSDGLIDDAERAAMERESGSDAETAAWLQAEYAQPASIEQIAASVGSDEALAAETYLAARLVCADLSRKEIVFLSRLSQALNLDDQLVESLEKQIE